MGQTATHFRVLHSTFLTTRKMRRQTSYFSTFFSFFWSLHYVPNSHFSVLHGTFLTTRNATMVSFFLILFLIVQSCFRMNDAAVLHITFLMAFHMCQTATCVYCMTPSGTHGMADRCLDCFFSSVPSQLQRLAYFVPCFFSRGGSCMPHVLTSASDG